MMLVIIIDLLIAANISPDTRTYIACKFQVRAPYHVILT
jgi:hypothetical protein